VNAIAAVLNQPTKPASWPIYREILDRENAPKPGDAEALKSAMAALGKSRDDLERDVRATRWARSLQALIDESPNHLPALRAANAAIEAHDAEMTRIIDGLKARKSELHREALEIDSKVRESQQASSDLVKLRMENRELFGLPPRELPAAPINMITALTAPMPKQEEPDYSCYPKPYSSPVSSGEMPNQIVGPDLTEPEFDPSGAMAL
jgi:hypothetical protein